MQTPCSLPAVVPAVVPHTLWSGQRGWGCGCQQRDAASGFVWETLGQKPAVGDGARNHPCLCPPTAPLNSFLCRTDEHSSDKGTVQSHSKGEEIPPTANRKPPGAEESADRDRRAVHAL